MFRLRTAAAITLTGTLAFAAAPSLLQEMMMPKPTEEHAMVQKGIGEWEGTVAIFMPGMPEQEYPATESVRAHGPFWTTSDFSSAFMGMDYSGHGCHGYDPAKGKYVSTWIDNMSSQLQVMEGEVDAETGMLVMEWDAPDMTGAVVPHRSEHKFGDDAYTMTFFTNGMKSMVIEMKRVSAEPIEASAR